MHKDDVKFQIDQLRQDKIIYAVEAIALNSAMALLAIGSMFSPYGPLVVYGSVFAGLAYTIYVAASNAKRLQKIRRLESSLQKNT